MSLKIFMQELETELEAIPVQRRQEIIKDFDSQIKKAIDLGDTEEYLLKILGEPSSVAEKFIAQEAVEDEPESELKIETNTGIKPVTGSIASEIRQYDIESLTINGEMLDVNIEAGNK